MGYYDLSKVNRQLLSDSIRKALSADFKSGSNQHLLRYFADDDTYIRKAAYLATGRIYQSDKNSQLHILRLLHVHSADPDHAIRQTSVNAAGEIGMNDFEKVISIFDKGILDTHHTVRNAVIGSVKKMSQKNPEPVLNWAKQYLHHSDKEVRREICHGIELRGRTHPQDILELLRELEHDATPRVRNTLVHVIGQISYKRGCLPTVIAHLHTWTNKAIVADAAKEIIDVHDRYKEFAFMTHEEAKRYIEVNLKI